METDQRSPILKAIYMLLIAHQSMRSPNRRLKLGPYAMAEVRRTAKAWDIGGIVKYGGKNQLYGMEIEEVNDDPYHIEIC